MWGDAVKTIDQLLWLRAWLIKLRRPIYRWLRGVDIPPAASVSFSARFIATPRGPITIGDHTLVAFKTLILGIDRASGKEGAVHIGRNCFIGGGSLIMPGVTIGDGSIVGAGSVVDRDVPADSIVVGNPARVVRTGIQAGSRGRLPGADSAAAATKAAARQADAGRTP